MRFLWLIVVLVATAYLGIRLHEGLKFQTDLMALLPREQQDKELQTARDKVSDAFSQRVIILIGNKDRGKARAAASDIANSGLMKISSDGLSKDRLSEMGKLYYPYRFNLLTEQTRQLLQQNKSGEVATNALSQVYGTIGMANATLFF